MHGLETDIVLTILRESALAAYLATGTMSGMTIESPPFIATEAFTDVQSAIARLEEIYERNTRFLRDRFEAYLNGEVLTARVRATYPFVDHDADPCAARF